MLSINDLLPGWSGAALWEILLLTGAPYRPKTPTAYIPQIFLTIREHKNTYNKYTRASVREAEKKTNTRYIKLHSNIY